MSHPHGVPGKASRQPVWDWVPKGPLAASKPPCSVVRAQLVARALSEAGQVCGLPEEPLTRRPAPLHPGT